MVNLSGPWAPCSYGLAADGTSLDEALVRVPRQPGAAGPSTICSRGIPRGLSFTGGDRYQELMHAGTLQLSSQR